MKIYCLTPWAWRPHFDWFRRDLGLIADALSAKGHQAKLVLHTADGMPHNDERMLGVNPQDLKKVSWWADQAPDLVITLAGSRPSELAVNLAIHKAGVSLWNKMDNDGIFGNSIEPLLSIYSYWWHSRYSRTAFPLLRSLAIHAVRSVYPKVGDLKAIQLLEPCDRILLESPIACARLQRFFRQHHRADLERRVTWLPGIVPDDRNYDSSIPKEKTVIAVGRWRDWLQKDTPKLFRVLELFLSIRSDYSAIVIGLSDERVHTLWQLLSGDVKKRVRITGRLPNIELTSHFQRSKISLCVSRGESFHNVSGEAVCCGCSVVGPAQISPMLYFTTVSSGTPSWSRSDGAILDALCAEAAEWDRGARNAGAISKHFRAEISASAIAERVEELCEQNRWQQKN